MFERFCAGQNIRALMREGITTDDYITPLQTRFLDIFASDARGTLLNDLCAFESTQLTYGNHTRTTVLEPELDQLLCRTLVGQNGCRTSKRRVLSQRSVTLQGTTYSCSDVSQGDSQIVYGNYPRGPWRAGQISKIFVHRGHAYFVVLQFRELSPEHQGYDHYRLFPGVGGKLTYGPDHLESGRVLLRLEDIRCHFAAIPHINQAVPRPCVHVLPLDRVCFILFKFLRTNIRLYRTRTRVPHSVKVLEGQAGNERGYLFGY